MKKVTKTGQKITKKTVKKWAKIPTNCQKNGGNFKEKNEKTRNKMILKKGQKIDKKMPRCRKMSEIDRKNGKKDLQEYC